MPTQESFTIELAHFRRRLYIEPGSGTELNLSNYKGFLFLAILQDGLHDAQELLKPKDDVATHSRG
jgi:hypothetical protein